jgi:hypothetical protein
MSEGEPLPASKEPLSPSPVSEEKGAAPPVLKCDVCEAPLEIVDEDDEGMAPSGRGLYLWSRGGEVVYEEVPLCAACGTAIGVSALARWEIEEEEG